MDQIKLERSERIKMFFNEYYFGVSAIPMVFRIVGGPVIFYFGLQMYLNAEDRFGIGYGGIMVAFSIYYTFKPFWWVLVKWQYYKPIEFQLATTEDKLMLKEGESESQTEFSKFEQIIRRKKYFSLRIQKGLKIYLPVNKLSEETISILNQKTSNK